MKNINKIQFISFVLLAVLLTATTSFAGTAAPWDTGLNNFIGLFQGRLALGIFLCVAIGATWAVIKGGELDDWIRKMLVGVIIVSSLIAIANLFTLLFGTAGALI